MQVRDVEHAFFAPVVMPCIGGLAPAASVTLKRLSALVADKEDKPYNTVIAWLRTKLSFAMLYAAVVCPRCTRSSRHRLCTDWLVLDLHVTESQIWTDNFNVDLVMNV